MIDRYTFVLSYFEQVNTLPFSLENFQIMAEEELEQKIQKYLKENCGRAKELLYWEMDGEDQTERDVFHSIRPIPDCSYLYFKEELNVDNELAAEEQAIAIGEEIGLNSFHLMKNGQRLAVFVKLNKQWFWLPLDSLSNMPKFQHPLFPFSEIYQGEQFFSTLLKT